MTDAPEADPNPQSASPYVRLPAPLVGGVIAVFLLALLAFGLYANANLRTRGTILPTPNPTASAPLVAATSTQAAPTRLPATATPPPAATSTPRSQPASTPVLATGTAGRTPLIVVVASPTSEANASAQTPAVTPLPTVDPTLAGEIGAAYEEYWRVRSQALLDLDATHLAEVMTGDYLVSFEANLKQLAAQGKAIKTQISLNYMVVEASHEDAVIVDSVEDDSYYVTAGTEDALSEPANDLLRLEVKLKKVEGVWKVVESVSAD